MEYVGILNTLLNLFDDIYTYILMNILNPKEKLQSCKVEINEFCLVVNAPYIVYHSKYIVDHKEGR